MRKSSAARIAIGTRAGLAVGPTIVLREDRVELALSPADLLDHFRAQLLTATPTFSPPTVITSSDDSLGAPRRSRIERWCSSTSPTRR